MTGEASTSVRFQADFKKKPGTLTITSTHIAWVPTEKDAMDRQSQALNRAISMLASKPDKPKVSLKVVFKDDIPVGGLLFTFTNPTTNVADRQRVQDLLIPHVSANRLGMPAPSTPNTPLPSTPTGAAAAVQAVSSGLKGKRKADELSGTAVSSPGGSGSGIGEVAPPRKKGLNSLRKKVLSKNETLRMLHREMVLGGQITEAEFWDGREAMLQAEEMASAQRAGRPSRLLDDRFGLDGSNAKKEVLGQGGTGIGTKKVESGPQVISLTHELMRELFEEFPVVQDAYAKHVPGISEGEFWSRYFTSTLWERHRASERKSANDEIMRKKDDIFDQYLEEPDWNIKPRKTMPDDVERFLDLAATEEDHGETSTIRDHTMQSGRERSSLPLMRRFNNHSSNLLRAGTSTNGTSAVTGDRDIYSEIDLEDLHGPAAPATIPLDVPDEAIEQERVDETTRGVLPGKTDEELVEIALQELGSIREWHADFSEICIPSPAGGWVARVPTMSPDEIRLYEKFKNQRDSQAAAMLVVKDMHVTANAETAIKTPLPNTLLDQMTSCHTAASEFLRQYWSAILPLQPGALGAGTPATSASARAGKAARMAGYLALTEAKVNAVVETAIACQADPVRVRAALAPTLGAVKIALAREKKRVEGG